MMRIEKESGQILILVLLLILPLILFAVTVFGIGQMIDERIRLQNAIDSAALSAAIWQARGLNIITDINYPLVLTAIAALKDPQLWPVVENFKKAQDIANKTFSGAAALSAYETFKENSGGGLCVPLPFNTTEAHMFSLRLRRADFLDMKLHMMKDTPNFWIEQDKKGPFVRLMGTKEGQELFWGGKMLGIKIPKIIVVAQAKPYRNEQKLSKYFAQFGGDLWNPTFRAKLMPVNSGLPIAKEVVLH
jgi:hypothetical protein